MFFRPPAYVRDVSALTHEVDFPTKTLAAVHTRGCRGADMLRDDEWSPSEISSEHDLLSQFDARSGPGALPIPGLESILGDPGKSLEAAAGAGMPVPPAPGVLSMPVPTHMSTPTANGPSASARCLKLTCRARLRRRGACVPIGAKHCCRESNGTRIHGAVQIVRALPRAVL